MTYIFFRYFLCVLPSSPKTLTIFLCIENNLLGSVQTTTSKYKLILFSNHPWKKNCYHFLKVSISLARWGIFTDIFCLKLNEVEPQTKPITHWVFVIWLRWFVNIKLKFSKFDLQGSGNTIASVRSEVRAAHRDSG